jgi:hypothetical protein
MRPSAATGVLMYIVTCGGADWWNGAVARRSAPLGPVLRARCEDEGGEEERRATGPS